MRSLGSRCTFLESYDLFDEMHILHLKLTVLVNEFVLRRGYL